VLGLLIKLLKAILESLYMLFEGMPALEALRGWLEKGEGAAIPASAIILVAGALLLGLAAFALFLLFIRRGSFALRKAFERED